MHVVGGRSSFLPWYYWIASGFGLGLLFAPGTLGSMLAFPLIFVLSALPFYYYLFTSVLLCGLLFYVSIRSYHWLGCLDHKSIVADEIIGMYLVLMFFPSSWFGCVCLFFLFRFFDIYKPGLVGIVDQSQWGGFEVVLDDMVAGVYTVIAYQLFGVLESWFLRS